MLVVYDSRFGSGKAFAEKLGMPTQSVSEELKEECILGKLSSFARVFLVDFELNF